jgi:hypothetical protein
MARLSTPPKKYETYEGQKWAEDVRREVNLLQDDVLTRELILKPYVSTAVGLTLDSTHMVVETTAAVAIVLPTAVGVTGKTYIIDNSSAGNTTVTVSGGGFINGVASQTIPADSAMNVYSNGTNWRIM